MKRCVLLLLCLSVVLPSLAAQAPSEKELIKRLPPHHREWLTRDVVYIITAVEKEVFLKLETDREREVFINAFWKQRDPNPGFPENLYKKEHYRRLEYANKWFGRDSPSPGWRTDMGRIYITLGEPKSTEKFVNETELCPTEIWFYQGMASYGLPDSFNIVFFKEDGVGEFVLYTPVRFGPHTLLRNYEGDRALPEVAFNQLMEIQPKVAEVSLTLISGEPLGQPSLASEMLVREKIPQAPQKKVNNIYATKFLKYRGVVEIEYADNYVDNSSQFNVVRDRSGHFFIHYLVEPQRLSFDHYENQYFTDLDVSGNISDKKGRVITQIKRKLPLRLSQEMMDRVKDKLFSLQDVIPVVPGEHHLSLIIKNSAGMEFTSVEKDFSIKDPKLPSISPLILGNRKTNLENAALTKPYSFSGVQILPSPRNDFISTDDLNVFFQVYAPSQLKSEGFVEFSLIGRGDAQVWSLTKSLKEYPHLPDALETIPLKDFSYAYYIIKVRLLDREKAELASSQEQFYITPQARLPRPWVVSQPIAGYVSVLHELARQNVESGRQEEARRLFEQAVKMDTDSTALVMDYCKLLLKTGDHERLKELALPMFKEKSRFEFALILGELSQKLLAYDEAISYYAEFLTRFGAQPEVFNRIAECYMGLELPEEALKAWKKSLEIEPRQTEVKKKVAELQEKSKK